VWGNATAKPHCVFQAKPIPNSNKIVFIGAAHHAITAGPVCVLDPAVDVNSLDAVSRITPLPFPEAEGKLDEWYAAPWPLSDDTFLVAYSPYSLRFQGEHRTNPNPDHALGIYLLDAAGNRELLYRDPDISTTNPTPLTTRARPPIIAKASVAAGREHGTMVVTDVYQGLGDVPRGTIKELRIVQVFPKSTWLANKPRMGVAGEENGRAILGSVPVESDGSAYFQVPAGKPVLFQALDAHGMAYQTMRSLTFVQPGEQTSCVGCHEHRMASPPLRSHTPLALRRPPSSIQPGSLGGRPFGFVEVVQPLLDQHCVRCHGSEKAEGDLDLSGRPYQGFTRSYVSLCGTPDAWKSRAFDPTQARLHLVPRFVQRNQIQQTPPGGVYGARGSRLMQLLLEGHEGVQLSDDAIRRLAAWIDLNAIFYGVYDADGQARQLAGQRVAMPEIQ
jgi:cytochrome c553